MRKEKAIAADTPQYEIPAHYHETPPAYSANVLDRTSARPNEKWPAMGILSLKRNDSFQLTQFPTAIVDSVRKLLPLIWPKGIQDEQSRSSWFPSAEQANSKGDNEISKCYEFKLRGRPWLSRTNPSGEGGYVMTVRLIKGLIMLLESKGWVLHMTTEMGRQTWEGESFFFLYDPASRALTNSASSGQSDSKRAKHLQLEESETTESMAAHLKSITGNWFAIVIDHLNHLRLVDDPPEVRQRIVQYLLEATTTSILEGVGADDHVVVDRDRSKCLVDSHGPSSLGSAVYDIELKLSIVTNKEEKALKARMLMLRILQILQSNGWAAHVTSDLCCLNERRDRGGNMWLFRKR